MAIVETGLQRYLKDAGPNAYPELRRPLSDLPLTLEDEEKPGSQGESWVGADQPLMRTKLPYETDDLLYRHYGREPSGPAVDVYMVYSKLGDDRKHHPEICIRDVAGAPEDPAGRKLIQLDADGKRVVQRFRFLIGPAEAPLTIYYWHY